MVGGQRVDTGSGFGSVARRTFRVAGAIGALIALASPTAPPAAAQPATSGVTAHFGQGWPLRLADDARDIGVTSVRDGVSWSAVERTPGRFEFTAANSGHIDRICRSGMTVLLGIEPRNRLYDAGQTAFSPGAVDAFARYVRALADRWPACLVAVEIGNEINGRNGVTGPAAADRIASHVALLKAVSMAVKPAHPALAVLGGSTNTIGLGFLAALVRAGALKWADGFAVHPYRQVPEGAEQELARLRAVVGRADKQIWATEFSRAFVRPEEAAGYYLKMTVLMESAGVTRHYWYALADQPRFPTMGLMRFNGERKPASQAFSLAARILAPEGPPVRLDADDPTLFRFRYGNGYEVIWGAPRSLSIEGAGARVFAADGTPQVRPTLVGEEPIVVSGASAVRVGAPRILADSTYGFGRGPLEWFATVPGGPPRPLAMNDWSWTGFLGNRAAPGLAITQQGIGTSGGLGSIVRYPVREDGSLFASVCLVPPSGLPPVPATARLVRGHATLWSAAVKGSTTAANVKVAVRAGDAIDLVLAPEGSGAARLRYRFRIARDAEAAAPCPLDRAPGAPDQAAGAD